MKLTAHLHLLSRSRMHGAIPPLFQYAFMAWCSVKVHGQLYLYLNCSKLTAVSYSDGLLVMNGLTIVNVWIHNIGMKILRYT
jgi:hypothetical protein